MTDDVFEYEELKLLAKRPSAVREHQLQALEFRALFEETADATVITSTDYPVGSDAFRFVSGGKGRETSAPFNTGCSYN